MTKRRGKVLDLIDGPLDLFIGIDLHKDRWNINIMTREVELFSGNILEGGSLCGLIVFRCKVLDKKADFFSEQSSSDNYVYSFKHNYRVACRTIRYIF